MREQNIDVNDAEIISGCIKNSKYHQHLLYKKYSSKLYPICLRYANCKADANDILHDAFLKIYNKIHTFRKDGNFYGWIRKIVVNQSLDYIRFKKPTLNIDTIPIEQLPEETAIDIIDKYFNPEQLINLIQKLPTSYRTVFNLYVLDGYSHQEIANTLNIAVGSSKSALSRAKQQLRELLAKEYVIN